MQIRTRIATVVLGERRRLGHEFCGVPTSCRQLESGTRAGVECVPPGAGQELVSHDFFEVDCAATLKGPEVLFVMDHATRVVAILGMTEHPTG